MRAPWWVTAVVLAAVGCSAPRGEPYRPPDFPPDRGEDERASEAELVELLELAELAIVGRVVERREEPEGVGYRVEVLEVLHTSPSLKGAVDHPHSVGKTIGVSSFVFRPDYPMTRLRRLTAPTRYLFFLGRMEREGWWLHLDDASAYALPGASEVQATLRRLAGEGKRGPAQAEGR